MKIYSKQGKIIEKVNYSTSKGDSQFCISKKIVKDHVLYCDSKVVKKINVLNGDTSLIMKLNVELKHDSESIEDLY